MRNMTTPTVSGAYHLHSSVTRWRISSLVSVSGTTLLRRMWSRALYMLVNVSRHINFRPSTCSRLLRREQPIKRRPVHGLAQAEKGERRKEQKKREGKGWTSRRGNVEHREAIRWSDGNVRPANLTERIGRRVEYKMEYVSPSHTQSFLRCVF